MSELPRWPGNAAHIAVALLLVTTALVMAERKVGPADFVGTPPIDPPPIERIDTYATPPAPGVAHAPTAVLLNDGRLAAYWFSGAQEAGRDVQLRMAIFAGGTWDASVPVTDVARTGGDERVYVNTLGNPIVFRHPNGEFWLIYVSSIGGWSASSLNLMRSSDGIAWGPAKRLSTSPFFNISTLLRGAPLYRSDGLVLVPAYHELIRTFPEFLLINADGQVVDRVRLNQACTMQAWPIALGGGKAVALLRQAGCSLRRLWIATTTDGGVTWQGPHPTDIANPDSPAAAVRLADGRIVAVLNNSEEGSATSILSSRETAG